MIIAGIPIATVAIARARASIMTIPLFGHLSTSDRQPEKPFWQLTFTPRLLQAYFAHKGFGFAVCGKNRASISQFVAGIGHNRSSNGDDLRRNPFEMSKAATRRHWLTACNWRGPSSSDTCLTLLQGV
jgi:hypothetical protein